MKQGESNSPFLESLGVLKANDFIGVEERPAASKPSKHCESSLKLFRNGNNN